MLENIYNIMPYFIKCIMATVKGGYLNSLRYDIKTESRIQKYIDRESWDKKKWDAWIVLRLQETLYNARNNIPYYKKYWDESREKKYELLENWPILVKEDINKCPELFIDKNYNRFKLFNDHTSGTTGTPLDLYIDYDSVKEQYALFEARVKRKYNISITDPWAIIGSQRVTPIARKKPPFWVYNFASRQLYLSSLHIASWSGKDYLCALKKYQPKCLIGYTQSIYELATILIENNEIFSLKAVITNAEPLFDYQKINIEKAFDCPVVETFGQAELVAFANSFPDGKLYESPEMGVSEVLDLDDGNEAGYGKLIATGILNKAMPLIRYDTKDLISIKKISHNKGLPEYGKIIGRNDDVIVLSDGRKIVQIDGVFSSDLNIKKAQIIQHNFSEFSIKIVPGKKWVDLNQDIIIKRFHKRLGEANIRVEVCEDIQSNWAGKFRIIKSSIVL